MEKSSTPDTPDSDESHVAFELFNADDPSGSDETPRLRRQRVLHELDSENSTRIERAPLIRQPLLRTIYQELSQLVAEADGVSEKVKVPTPNGRFYVYSCAGSLEPWYKSENVDFSRNICTGRFPCS